MSKYMAETFMTLKELSKIAKEIAEHQKAHPPKIHFMRVSLLKNEAFQVWMKKNKYHYHTHGRQSESGVLVSEDISLPNITMCLDCYFPPDRDGETTIGFDMDEPKELDLYTPIKLSLEDVNQRNNGIQCKFKKK